jgi:hypothetical protein
MASEWGRIDDDGTVYVRTADGERAIGSWQAGDPAEGLAYYERRYADLATEIDLLRRRLDSGAGEAKATWNQAAALQDTLGEVAAIGDLGALATALAELRIAAEAKLAEQLLARDEARLAAVTAKEALVAEAEKLAAGESQWKASGDRMRAIVEDWKNIKGIDRKTDEALWKRYAAARDEFGRRRGQHFAGLDAERTQVKAAKEKLIAEAEKLSTSTDWRDTGDAMKALMAKWKDAGRTSKSEEDALWKRFRAAQDAFFAKRSETFAERDAEQIANQKSKETLIAEAEGLDLSDPRKAQARLRDIGDRFDAVGHVPRDAMKRLDDRMRAAEQRVRAAADSARPTATPIVTNPFLAAMLERVAEAEAKVERARKAGDAARIAKAEQDLAQRRALLPS